jgi:hypothetical protein
MASDRLVNLTEIVSLGQVGLTLNELRWLIQYEGIPVYRDGRTRTRYLDADGVRRLKGCEDKFRDGKLMYFQARIHPAFYGSEGENGRDATVDQET